MLNVQKLLCLFVLFLLACKESIVHDLSEHEANRLFTKLYAAGIKPEKQQQADGDWSILVENSNIFAAIQLLDDGRFFKKKQKITSNPGSFLSYGLDQKLNFQNSLSAELEKTLYSLSGVLEVHVHLNLGEKKNFWEQPKKPAEFAATAAVLMIVAKEFNLSSQEIKDIVSGAAGISSNNVSVVMNYPQILNNSDKEITIRTQKLDFSFINVPMFITFFGLIWLICSLVAKQKRKNFKKMLQAGNFLEKSANK